MSGQHRQRILINIIHSLSTWILPLLLGLVVTRVVVRTLGHEDYGIYALVIGFIAYSFNFSIGRAITKYLAEFKASGETEKTREMISATVFLTLVVAVIGGSLIIGLSGVLVREVFDIELAVQEKAVFAINLSAAIIIMLMIGQTASAVFQGLHRFDLYSRFQNANSIVMMLGNLVIAWLGYGLLPLLFWNLSVAALLSAISVFFARRLLPEFTLRPVFSRRSLVLVLGFSVSVIGYQIFTNAFFLFERGWIISHFGVEALTFYVIPMTVGIYLHGFVFSLSMVLFPLASEMEQDRERLLRLYGYATKAVLFVVVILATTLIVEGRIFLTLWLGPEFGERSTLLLVVHTIAFALAAIVIVSFQTAEALGRPAVNLRNMALGVFVAVPLMIGLTASFGEEGVALGRVAVFSVSLMAIGLLEQQIFGRVQWDFWLPAIARLLPAAAAAALIEASLLRYLPAGWFALIVAAGAGALTYTGVLIAVGFASEQDRSLMGRLLAKTASDPLADV